MKTIFGLIVALITIIALGITFGSKTDPYKEGRHFGYTIKCQNGYVYKLPNRHYRKIQVLNSDGTPLKCGQKAH